jgi:hypothetical protein
MRRALLLLLATACLLGGLTAPTPSFAEDEDAGALVTQILDVDALTSGVTSFLPAQLGTTAAWQVSEESPLFGAEGEEPILPVGTIDELVEVLKASVDPLFWEVTEGADIRPLGEGRLVVRATPDVLALLAQRIAQFERRTFVNVRVDFVFVNAGEGDLGDAGPLSEERVRSFLAPERVRGFLSMTALPDQAAVAWAGSQRAYVEDYDVEVAQKASVGDPIVGVQNLGFQVRMRAAPSGEDGRLYLEVQAQSAAALEGAHLTLPEDTRIELPHLALAPIRFERVVASDAWYLAPGVTLAEAPLALLFRARLLRPALGPARVAPLPAWPAPDTAALEVRFFDVQDLAAAPWNRVGTEINLVPSNFTPPEPPELADPTPIVPADALVELLFEVSPSRTWNRADSSIEARNGQLIVRQTPRVLEAIETQIDHLRARYLRSTAIRLDLLDVPTRLALALDEAPGPDAGLALGERALAGLEAAVAAGDARRLGQLRTTAVQAARQAVEQGVVRHYLQDYEVEIAEESTIANPVVRKFFEGLVGDVRPTTASGGEGVKVTLRFTASHLEEMGQTATPHGPIDLPAMGILRSRGDVFVPLGRTALVLAGGDGSRSRILLLTASVQPR